MIDYFISQNTKTAKNGLFSRYMELCEAISGEIRDQMHSDGLKTAQSIQKGGRS